MLRQRRHAGIVYLSTEIVWTRWVEFEEAGSFAALVEACNRRGGGILFLNNLLRDHDSQKGGARLSLLKEVGCTLVSIISPSVYRHHARAAHVELLQILAR
jgi:hypothetical protein